MSRLLQLFFIAALFVTTSCGVEESLDGRSWKMTTLNGESLSADVAVEPSSFSLTFGEDGSVGGMGVCNRLIGRYTSERSGEVRIEGVGATLMFCPNLELESEYIKLLESVTRYEIAKSMLTFYSGDEEVLTFNEVVE